MKKIIIKISLLAITLFCFCNKINSAEAFPTKDATAAIVTDQPRRSSSPRTITVENELLKVAQSPQGSPQARKRSIDGRKALHAIEAAKRKTEEKRLKEQILYLDENITIPCFASNGAPQERDCSFVQATCDQEGNFLPDTLKLLSLKQDESSENDRGIVFEQRTHNDQKIIRLTLPTQSYFERFMYESEFFYKRGSVLAIVNQERCFLINFMKNRKLQSSLSESDEKQIERALIELKFVPIKVETLEQVVAKRIHPACLKFADLRHPENLKQLTAVDKHALRIGDDQEDK